MIPAWLPTLAAFAVACGYLTAIGLPFARLAMPCGVPPLGIAPAFGWAVVMALALPLLSIFGFSRQAVLILLLAGLLGAAALRWRGPHRSDAPEFPRWGMALAAVAAWLPAMAIMPTHAAGGLLLAPPMFDHVKIAAVDAILRDGLPVPNPFIGPANPGHLTYYYLWHVGAAVLARALHIGGWSAEAAMTGFTAFASLMVMLALTVSFGSRALGVAAAVLLCLPGSARPVIAALIGTAPMHRLIAGDADIGGWLNQAAWVPQHLAAACCAVVAALLMRRLADTASLCAALCLGLTIAAGFESSVWIGGIGVAAGGAALGLRLAAKTPTRQRCRFVCLGIAAAAIAGVLILPLFIAELHAARAHGPGPGIGLAPYPVFATLVPAPLRPALDLGGYWLLLLPFVWPAILPLSLFGARTLVRTTSAPNARLPADLLLFALAFLCVGWLWRSTIDNNDLGWRVGLPALLVLTAMAATALDRVLSARRWALAATLLAVAAVGLPDSARMLFEYARGQRPADAPGFARSAALWQAVRRHAGPDDRIANNPLFLGSATPWPVNISWATLSDRPSCYAGWATVIAYGALPPARLLALNDRFTRVFNGSPLPGDVRALAQQNNCAVVVLVPGDPAWRRDPFAGGPIYEIAESTDDWRIYRRVVP